jgi:hypothetical protein
MLQQSISVVEWSHHWSVCRAYVNQISLPPLLQQATLDCLQRWWDFSESGSLALLDRALGDLSGLVEQWDHCWWVARRSGSPWPTLGLPPAKFTVTRQGGRSRINWTCPRCDWELSWDLEVCSWERPVWPGDTECPMCSAASSGDPHPVESRGNEFGT